MLSNVTNFWGDKNEYLLGYNLRQMFTNSTFDQMIVLDPTNKVKSPSSLHQIASINGVFNYNRPVVVFSVGGGNLLEYQDCLDVAKVISYLIFLENWYKSIGLWFYRHCFSN